jgi:hypothetical protein
VGLSASRILFVACFGGCAFLSLQPSEKFERWIDVALIPARVLAELASPLRWTRARSVAAAQSTLAQLAEADYEARRTLADAERAAVVPSRADASEGRKFVHAVVVGRRDKHADQLVIEPDNSSCAGLAIGMPVAVGDVFVGRIAELDAHDPSRAYVSLVTAKNFTLGARIDPPSASGDAIDDDLETSVHAVAGGVIESHGALYLALHNPSARVPIHARVRVDESLSALDPYAKEAQGFELGRTVALERDQIGIQPLVDYRAGLFELVVVAPSTIERAPDQRSDDLLYDDAWRTTRALSSGEPSRARAGLKIASGSWNDAREGAAVVAGARLVGTIARAAPLWSDVRTLGDPGLRVPVIARVEGRAAPIALGTFVALGRASDGDDRALAFEWNSAVPLDVPGDSPTVRAALFTGSGDPNLPRGLVIGDAELPRALGVHRIAVHQEVPVGELATLWIYRAPREVAKP